MNFYIVCQHYNIIAKHEIAFKSDVDHDDFQAPNLPLKRADSKYSLEYPKFDNSSTRQS